MAVRRLSAGTIRADVMPRRWLLRVAATALLLLGARGVRAEDAPTAPAEKSEPGAAWRDVPTLERHLAAACDAVEKACGAKYERRPTVRVATRDMLVEVLKAQTPELAEGGDEGKAMEAVLPLLSKALLGLYDVGHHAILVSGENAAAMEKDLPLPGLADEDVLRVVLAHEATHALDWPRWKFTEARASRRTNDSRQAFAAVAEGHAQLVAEEIAASWGLTRAFERMTRAIVSLPEKMPEGSRVIAEIVAAEVAFGYVQGHRFLKAVRAARGAAGVDAMLKDPPTDTAVIEHPESVFDKPSAVFTTDLDLLVAQFEPLVGDAQFKVSRDRVRETMIKSQAGRLPPDRRADSDGRIRLRGAPVEEFELNASARGAGPYGPSATVRVASGAKRVEIVLRMSRDTPGGDRARPLKIAGLRKGDRVQFFVDGDEKGSLEATEDGVVNLPYALEAPEFTVWVGPRGGVGLLATRARVDAPLALLPTKAITGRLKDAAPLRHAEIAAVGPGRILVVGHVEDDGSFEFELPPGRYTLRAKARTDAAWVYGAVEADAGVRDVEVPLAPRGK